MRMKVLQFPLIKITGFFVLGIVFAHYTKPKFSLVLISILVGISLLSFLYIFSKKKRIQQPYFGIATFVVSFLIGVFTLTSNDQTLNPNHYIHQLNTFDKENILFSTFATIKSVLVDTLQGTISLK